MATAGAPPSQGLLGKLGGAFSRAPGNLADAFSNPEAWMWLSNVGAALDRSARGKGYDLSQANAGLMQGIQQRKAGEKLQGLMGNMNLNPQQQQFLGTLARLNPQVAMEIAGRQLFPQGGESKYGLNVVWGRDANGRLVPMQANQAGGLRAAQLPEGVTEVVQPWNDQMIDVGTGYMRVNPRGGGAAPVAAPAGGAPAGGVAPVPETPGVPAPVPAPGGAFIPKDVGGEAAAKAEGGARGKQTVEEESKLRKMAETAGSTIQVIDKILNDPYLDDMVGPVAGRKPNLSGAAARVQSNIDQLKGKAFVQAFDSLKGGGQITEREGQAATAASTQLASDDAINMNPEDYRAALKELRTISENAIRRARGEKVEEYISPRIKYGGLQLAEDAQRYVEQMEPGTRTKIGGKVYVWDGTVLIPQ